MLSDMFYILFFSILMFISIIGLVLCFIMLLIYSTNKKCRSVTGVISCNGTVATTFCVLQEICLCVYGLREDWASNEPMCKIRACFTVLAASSICYSHSIQAFSRLFLTVFHKQKRLATYRVHYFMIALNWIIATLCAMVPLFFNDAYVFEKETRLCFLTIKNLPLSIYSVIANFLIPLNISMMVYGAIIRYARSTRQAVTPASNTIKSGIPNVKREAKVARNMIIILTLFSVAGIPYLIVLLWYAIGSSNKPPDSFYTLSLGLISVLVVLMQFAQFYQNKEIKAVALGYLKCKRGRIHPNSNN